MESIKYNSNKHTYIKRNRLTDVESKLVVTSWEKGGGGDNIGIGE